MLVYQRACQLIYAAPSEYGHNHQQRGDLTHLGSTNSVPILFHKITVKSPFITIKNHFSVTILSHKIICFFFVRRLWDYLIGDPDNFKKNSFENRWRLNEMTGTGIGILLGGLIRCFMGFHGAKQWDLMRFHGEKS